MTLLLALVALCFLSFSPPPTEIAVFLYYETKDLIVGNKEAVVEHDSRVALKACQESRHVRLCDVVKLQKHRGCVQGMELENVAVPLSLASEEERAALAPAPYPLFANLFLPDVQLQFLSWATRVSGLFWREVKGRGQ